MIIRYNPACAGKTFTLASAAVSSSIQPRVCGENACRRTKAFRACDTTPRVRGKREPIPQTRIEKRYNPACAGKTFCPSLYVTSIAIQPRVCGENPSPTRSTMAFSDTTPRVRGKPPFQTLEGFRGRYNPACAGKTPRLSFKTGLPLIQPRVCGENALLTRSSTGVADTTPRVRGKQAPRMRGECSPRYNPACAGKTVLLVSHPLHALIQPRVCGENVCGDY